MFRRQNYFSGAAILVAATGLSLSHAQTAFLPSAYLSKQTVRCEVRPACAVMVAPDVAKSICPDGKISGEYAKNYDADAGCPNGLIEGVVKGERSRSGRTQHSQYKSGRRVLGMNTASYDDPSVLKTGDPPVMVSCKGSSPVERAKSAPLCEEAARVFGMAAFEGVDSPAQSPTDAALDDPKVLGGAYRPN